ncbi:MAG: integrin alpha, partial [Verrucomicrobiota bacterium]
MNADDLFGTSLAGLGDLNGDGVEDLAVGAHNTDDGPGMNRGAVHILFLNTDGTVKAHTKLNNDNITGLGNTDRFGESVANLGDIDTDGIPDLAIGATRDDDGGANRGAVYVVRMNTNGTPKAQSKITSASVGGQMNNNDNFGISVAGIGDVDGNLVPDLAFGSTAADDGGQNRGAIFIVMLNAGGNAIAFNKITSLTDPVLGIGNGDLFGASIVGVGDLTGDTIPDIGVGSNQDDDGIGNAGAIHLLSLDTDGTILANAKINRFDGLPLNNGDRFGREIANIGDLDGDGFNDIVVGALGDDANSDDQGAAYVLFLVTNGMVKAVAPKIGRGFAAVNDLDASDFFGTAVTEIGDVNMDGTPDLAVGVPGEDDAIGGAEAGGLYILFRNPNGEIFDYRKISAAAGNGETLGLAMGDGFGAAVAGLGDLNGDSVPDLAVGANGDDDGLVDAGAVYVLFLTTNGTVGSHTKISIPNGMPSLAGGGQFGQAIANLGDLNGDTVPELVVGAYLDSQVEVTGGAAYILFLNPSGNVIDFTKLTEGTVPFLDLDPGDFFGFSVTGIGDLDADGVEDIAVGAPFDDDGQMDAGASYVIFLNADGTAARQVKISAEVGGGPELDPGDGFGGSLGAIGDRNGDGITDLAVGA